MVNIHPSSYIHPNATIDKTVEIGPFCTIGADVILKAGVRLISHIVVDGHTEIGENTVIYPFASIGTPPQDLKFSGEVTRLVIGKHNTIREHVTMNPGTKGGGGLTQVGDHGLFMMGAHVAHDCMIGNHVIFANNATIGGHVQIGDYAILGGLTAVHQFVRIGAHAMIGGASAVGQDVIPFAMALGNSANLIGLNLIGLKRRGFTPETIKALQQSFEIIFKQNTHTFKERIENAQNLYQDDAACQKLFEFLTNATDRGFCQYR